MKDCNGREIKRGDRVRFHHYSAALEGTVHDIDPYTPWSYHQVEIWPDKGRSYKRPAGHVEVVCESK